MSTKPIVNKYMKDLLLSIGAVVRGNRDLDPVMTHCV